MNTFSKNVNYDTTFYEFRRANTLTSARIILSEFKKIYDFNSVADIGCGDCTWGLACGELNILDYIGIDGEHAKSCVHVNLLDRFISQDLETSEALPVRSTFDLVISLEVAERLTEGYAKDFISRLVTVGDVVMFSAAIPGQGGSSHVNEQWQSYWSSLFSNTGFIPFDLIRPAIWNNDQVAEYYRQNILIYCSNSRPDLIGLFRSCIEDVGPLFDVVHPYTYNRLRDLSQAPLLEYLAAFPKILKRVSLNRIGRQ